MNLKDLITRNILVTGNSIEAKRKELEVYFTKTYELFESVFDIFVNDDVFYERPEALRHQLIFYFGHTSTFFINKLIVAQKMMNLDINITRVNPEFESIFAIGVDEMSWDDLNEENYNWPCVNELRKYRKIVKDIVIDYIRTVDFTLPINWNSKMWPILMGIEHEKIHIETSSVLHRQLDIKFIKKNDFWNLNECKTYGNAPKNELIEVKGGTITLGKKSDSNLYGWDLEYGYYEENIKNFKASKFLVSNGEFLEFINDNGYKNDDFWSYEGKKWLEYKKINMPTFWSKKDDKYYYRTLTEIIELPLNWPVDVNFLEAEAFCNWKSKKTAKNITLPTEAQWHAFREYCEVNDDFNYGDYANINLERFSSSCEVNRFKFKHGFYDVVGNVWQWTKTPIFPFDGFKIHPIYDDFSVPTFDTRHNLFMGGSWVSTGNESTKYARYAFRRHFYQHAGFRYIEDENAELAFVPAQNTKSKIGEGESNDHSLQYLELDAYSSILETLKEIITENSKILNLGSYHGDLAIKIAQKFDNHITAIDFTARNVLVAQEKIEKLNLKNIEFWQGDSCNLKPHFKDYKIIIATNNYQELYDFDKFLNTLNDRLIASGYLIIKLLDFNANLEKLKRSFNKINEVNSVSLWQKK